MKRIFYETEFHNELPYLEKNNFWFSSRNKRIAYIFDKYVCNFNNILEIGCGTGYVLEMLSKKFPNKKITGGEFFDSGLNQANNRLKNFKNTSLIKLDARNMNFKEKFDVICAFDVIEHIKEEDKVLNQINKNLARNGFFIFSVPQHKFLWSAYDEVAFHKRRYVKDYLINKLQDNGFEIINLNSFNSLLLPLMYISRLKNKKIKKNFDGLKELRIDYRLNKILMLILDLEFFLIKKNITFKFGGSLIGIAKKVELQD